MHEDEEFLLQAGAFCLYATFTKDLSYKYGRYFDQEDGCSPSHAEKDEWCVAGGFDYLNFARFDSLERMIKEEVKQRQQVPWEDSRRLMLFPFSQPTPDEPTLCGILSPNPAEHPLLSIIQVTLSPTAFEVDAYQGGQQDRDRLGTVLRGVASLVILLQQVASKDAHLPRITYLGSLGSPDLVMVALPQDPEQLHAVHSFARVARTLRLAELKTGVLWEYPNADLEAGKVFPGHACVNVTPTLAFQLGAENMFSATKFRAGEEEHGLRLDFRLRVDCGHGPRVVQDVIETCRRKDGTVDVEFDSPEAGNPADAPWGRFGTDEKTFASKQGGRSNPIVASWDTHLIRGRFRHLEAFAKVWRKRWFNGDGPESWRSLNLLDSITDVSMSDDVAGWSQDDAHWVIAGSVRDDLKRIETQIEKFASKLLNPIQHNELRSVFNSFHSCFFRQDLLGTSRDLFPFFSQLGHALDGVEQWERYLGWRREGDGPDGGALLGDEPEDRAEAMNRWSWFQLGLGDLITHVTRVVRNRIEHRSRVGDPPFPQTLRAGTCKIVSAYTFVFHLCMELLRRSENDPNAHDDFCKAPHFAACVHAGTQGKVEIAELFEGYRQFVESDECAVERPRLLSQRKGDEWSSRLFLLEIPPQAMLRPELSIVHCLHEAAEVSDWIMLDRCDPLREVLNKWLVNEATSVFEWCIAEQSCRYPWRNDEPADQEIRRVRPFFTTFASKFVPYCLACYDGTLGDDSGQISARDVLTHLASVQKIDHPVALMTKVMDALYAVGSERENLAFFAKCMESSVGEDEKPLRPWGAQCCPEAVASSLFKDQLDSLCELVHEFIGDIGMYCSLHALLSPKDEAMPPDTRFEHLLTTFRSVYDVAAEAAPASGIGGRLERTILHRFAVQAAAVLPPEADIRSRIMGRLDDLAPGLAPEKASEYLSDSLDRQPQFGPKDSLVAGLRMFSPYFTANDQGTSMGVDLGFLRFHADDQDQVVRAFRRAWDESMRVGPARVEARLDLLLVLWAASNRFAISRLFDPLDPDKDQANKDTRES